jgi:hypothetical protein
MLAAFTWGYYGWGSHTRELVDAVDEIERARGWKPPLFVDIRWSRSVRAAGFQGSAFEKTVGNARYRWMKELGNRSIRTGSPQVRIAEPSTADELLNLIIEAAKQKRRVIFFCSCACPAECHRSHVARLLVKSAKRRKQRIQIGVAGRNTDGQKAQCGAEADPKYSASGQASAIT